MLQGQLLLPLQELLWTPLRNDCSLGWALLVGPELRYGSGGCAPDAAPPARAGAPELVAIGREFVESGSSRSRRFVEESSLPLRVPGPGAGGEAGSPEMHLAREAVFSAEC